MTVYPGGPQDSIIYELIAGDFDGTTNLMPTPSGEYGTSGWRTDSGALTLTQQTDSSNFARLGSYYVRYSGTPGSGGVFIGGNEAYGVGSNFTLVQPSSTYSWSMKVRCTAGAATYNWGWVTTGGAWATGSPVATNQALPTSSQGAIISAVAQNTPANGAAWQIEFRSSAAVATTIDFDGVIVHEGSILSSYFDGDVPGARWNGTTGFSSSSRGYRAVFNDPQDEDYVGMGYFAGLESAEIREAIDPRSGQDGGIQGMNFRGSRPIVLNTEIVASTTTERNTRFQKLKRASDSLRGDGALLFTPDGGLPMAAYVRKSGPVRRADERGWVYKVQLPLTAADPFLYSQSKNKRTTTTAPYQVTCTNQGDGRAAPKVEVTATSAGNISVQNVTTGQTVELAAIDPANIIQYIQKIGRSDYAGDPFQLYTFSNPYGIGIDASNNFYVVDYGHNAVKKYNSSGVFQTYIGTGLSGSYTPGELSHPTDAAIDASGNIYIANQGVNRVSKFNSSGTWVADTSTSMTNIYGVALDSSANVFVTDLAGSGTTTLRKFASTLGAQIGSVTVTGQPKGVAVDSSNQPWVACNTTKEFKKFSTAASPVLLNTYSTVVGGIGNDPYGLGIDSSNNVYISDITANIVQKFNSSGVYQTRFGTTGTGEGQFQVPALLDVRGTNMWVPDYSNNRVQQFSTTGTGTIVVDMATATVFGGTGLNLFQYVATGATQWWAMQPGDNVIATTGPGVTGATVTWRDAWD